MERQKRGVDEENQLWANPCDYDGDIAGYGAKVNPNYEVLFQKVATQAKHTYSSTKSYSKTIAKLHSYEEFTQKLLDVWKTDDWLRSINKDALPAKKVLDQDLPDEDIEEVITNINDKLPSMYMGLKMIVAGLHKFSKEGLNDNVANDDTLKENINQTMHDVRGVLCDFNDIMTARNLEIRPLLDADIPDFRKDPSFGLTLYRDTLNYLQYLHQVFSKLAEKQKESA